MNVMLVAGAIFVAAAIQSGVQLALAAPRREASFLSTREAEGVHLLMNAGMAFMLTPAYGAGSRVALTAAFVAAILALVTSLWLRREARDGRRSLNRGARAAGVGYHVLMLAAMIYAMFLMAPIAPMPSGAMGGMQMTPSPRSWLSLPRVLALVFALDAVMGALAVVVFPRVLIESAQSGGHAAGLAEDAEGRLRRQLRIGLLPHLVMDVGMTWMLISS